MASITPGLLGFFSRFGADDYPIFNMPLAPNGRAAVSGKIYTHKDEDGDIVAVYNYHPGRKDGRLVIRTDNGRSDGISAYVERDHRAELAAAILTGRPVENASFSVTHAGQNGGGRGRSIKVEHSKNTGASDSDHRAFIEIESTAPFGVESTRSSHGIFVTAEQAEELAAKLLLIAADIRRKPPTRTITLEVTVDDDAVNKDVLINRLRGSGVKAVS